MLQRLRKWLAGRLNPEPPPAVLVHRDGSEWEPRAARGVLLECVSGNETRLLNDLEVQDRKAFWTCWSALNMADVRWDDGEEFAPLD